MQCKARFITSGNRIVSNRQPEHTKYSDLYEHYVNSVKLVANNRLSIIDNNVNILTVTQHKRSYLILFISYFILFM